jgi:hypothetical protein
MSTPGCRRECPGGVRGDYCYIAIASLPYVSCKIGHGSSSTILFRRKVLVNQNNTFHGDCDLLA